MRAKRASGAKSDFERLVSPEAYDAFAFMDCNHDEWLGVVIPYEGELRLKCTDGAIMKLEYISEGWDEEDNRDSIQPPRYLGNVHKDEELAKRANIKWVKG